jgi:hypothetical protein
MQHQTLTCCINHGIIQVETLLLSDPGNEELREMYDSLSEVIQLTVDLLRDAGVAEAAVPAAAAAGSGRAVQDARSAAMHVRAFS